MDNKARIYIAAVPVASIVILAALPWKGLTLLSQEDVTGLIGIIALGLLADAFSFRLKVDKGNAASSLVFISHFATIILFPLPAVAASAVVTQTIAELLFHRRPLWKASFNVGQVVLSLVIAGLVYNAITGPPSYPLQNVAAFVGMSATFFAANHFLVGIGFALLYGGKFATVFVKLMGRAGANILYDVLVSPISVVLVLLYNIWDVPGLFVAVLPLLLIRHSYRINQDLLQANRDLLKVLIKAIDTRDPYTSGHSVRVSQLARIVAEDMDLPPGKVDNIEDAALVHDIGKVDLIYAEIIGKQGSLNDHERGVIVTHAAKGAEFLRTLATVKEEVVQGVRHHHERYDGSGYPDGLAGEKIPLPARIIMLCDSIDAMLSDRPYRKALPLEQVKQELIRHSGTQFDPKIVQVIVRQGTLERAVELIPRSESAPTMITLVG